MDQPDGAYMRSDAGKEGKKSPKWEEFNKLCCTLFNVLRKHSNLFINLISIMVRCITCMMYTHVRRPVPLFSKSIGLH